MRRGFSSLSGFHALFIVFILGTFRYAEILAFDEQSGIRLYSLLPQGFDIFRMELKSAFQDDLSISGIEDQFIGYQANIIRQR